MAQTKPLSAGEFRKDEQPGSGGVRLCHPRLHTSHPTREGSCGGSRLIAQSATLMVSIVHLLKCVIRRSQRDRNRLGPQIIDMVLDRLSRNAVPHPGLDLMTRSRTGPPSQQDEPTATVVIKSRSRRAHHTVDHLALATRPRPAWPPRLTTRTSSGELRGRGCRARAGRPRR
jgi:hypothetical protein